MSPPPTIKVLRVSIRECHVMLERVSTEYEWTVGMAYERTVADEAKVRVSEQPSQVESIAGSRRKQAQAKACERAQEDVLDALSKLRSAEARLLRVQDRADPVERPEPVRYPRTASRDDLSSYRDAKRRRQDRGEGVP